MSTTAPQQQQQRIAALLDQVGALTRENAAMRALSAAAQQVQPLFRFGVIADVQYCDIPDGASFDGTTKRYFRGALDCLRKAVAEWAAPGSGVSFVAQLGDIIDNQCQANKQTAADFGAVMGALEPLARRSVRLYNCIGNHELYNFSRAELASGPLRTVGPEGVEYYSFRPAPGWRFLVLDPYQEAIIGWAPGSAQHGAALAKLRAHNPNDVLGACDWGAGLTGDARRWVPYNGGLGAAQLAWMRAELQAATAAAERVVLLSHVLLHPAAAGGTTMAWDFDEAAAAMEGLEGCVAAVLCGHDHVGGYVRDAKTGIHHVTFQSPLNCGSSDMCHATVEVFADRLSIRGRGIVPSRELKL
jgi:manganese-dependent ADP-ribose/CDP-alcohol diphosphatase